LSGRVEINSIDYLEFARLLGTTKVFKKPFARQEFMNAAQGIV